MSVTNTTSKWIYQGTGNAGPFDFGRVYFSTDIVVEKFEISTETITTLTENVDYTVTLNSDKTGYVTLSSALTSSYKLILRRVLPLTQEVEYEEGDKFPSQSHEDALDRCKMVDMQQQEQLDRCLKVSTNETSSGSADDLVAAVESARDEAVQAAEDATNAKDLALNYAEAFTTTSTSSVSITVAQKTFTVSSGKQFVFGMPIIAMDSSSVANYMYGTVNSYSGTTLVIDVIFTGGSGTISSWNIFMTGVSGPKGDTGATGPAGSGAGDVLGPATNTDNYVPQWDGANSKTLKNGYPVGNGADSIPKTDGSSKLTASIIPDIDLTSMVTGVLPSANGGIDTTAWTDYSSTSTITGFSSYAYKVIRYKKIGRLVFVVFHINGVSNSSVKSFTLPASLNEEGSSDYTLLTYAYEQNGAGYRNFARGYINVNTLEIYSDMAGTGWATTGNVALRGSFFYEAVS